jgi:hypothetical protein
VLTSRDVEHQLIHPGTDSFQKAMMMVYQRTSDQGIYPTVTYRFVSQRSTKYFNESTPLIAERSRITPQNWVYGRNANISAPNSVNWITLNVFTISGFWASHQPTSQPSKSQKVPFYSVYSSMAHYAMYEDNPEFDDFTSAYSCWKTKTDSRTYGGGWTSHSYGKNTKLEKVYLLDLDNQEIKICKPRFDNFISVMGSDDFYLNCAMTKMNQTVSDDYYMTDVNMRSDMVGTYTYVERSSGKAKNGVFNLYGIAVLPDRNLDTYRVAANAENLFYVKMQPGSEPVIEILGRNGIEREEKRKEMTINEVLRREHAVESGLTNDQRDKLMKKQQLDK